MNNLNTNHERILKKFRGMSKEQLLAYQRLQSTYLRWEKKQLENVLKLILAVAQPIPMAS